MILGDYHTHTHYSRHGHGKGSVEDNVRAALALGLKEIALTDHGLRHGAYGMTAKAWPRFLAEVAAARAAHPEINIFTGLECNFLSPRGEIDVPSDKPDVIVCGYHKFIKPLKFGDMFSFFLPNVLTKNRAKTIARNTDAYLNALHNYPIDILSHPMHDCRIDLGAVGAEAVRLGTYIELNGKHRDMTADELVMLAELGCEFILDSDAHAPGRVGDVAIQLAALEEAGVPLTRVANWDRLPAFRSRREADS